MRDLNQGAVMMPPQLQRLEGRLIASCQAAEGDAFRSPESMKLFAQAALAGGAVAIRANSPEDIAAIRSLTDVPIIGIQKSVADDGRVLITPSFEAARALHMAGATCIALDVTSRGRQFGALERIRQIKEQLNVPVMADIATVEEGIVAAQGGADFVLSTLRGYTPETAYVNRFQPEFIRELVATCSVPVIAEGRIHTTAEARLAIGSGAFAVIIGTAITRPRDLASAFARAIELEYSLRQGRHYFVGIDLGGTNTKSGLVSSDGKLSFETHRPTPAHAGREQLLSHLKIIAREMLEQASKSGRAVSGVGVATAGWINPELGSVAYATENLPGWTGTPIAAELERVIDAKVAVENDANALAVAEKHFGVGRHYRDFLCITLGTGVGGGAYLRDRLNRGSHFFANAFGHLCIVPEGLPCSCGQRGCLEVYCNATALLRYGGPDFVDAELLIAEANNGHPRALSAVQTLGRYLAQGCALIIQMLDPQAIILSGGLAQNNPHLLRTLQASLSRLIPAWSERNLAIVPSTLGYYGGVMGAAAVAIEKLRDHKEA